MAIAILATAGCVAPVAPAACDGCDAPLSPDDPCAGLECAECFERLERPGAAALVRSAEAIVALAATLEVAYAAECDTMVAQLALRDAPSGRAACPVVTAEVEARIRETLPFGVSLAIADEPAVCRVPLEAASACAARCGATGATVRCEGALVGTCPGVCDGVCHGLCGATCEGTCSDFCDGSCDATCTGVCEGDCALRDRDGYCVVTCEGRCARGACDGTCDGSCTGVCTEACDDACIGACIGACDAAWAPACQGVVRVDDEACGLACAAAAAVDADCPDPEVRVRGPEAEDPRDHGLIDQLVLTASRDFEPLYALEARIRITLDPLLDALAVALAASPERCLPEREAAVRDAIARLRSIREEIRALLLAAERTVGENLD